MKSSTYFTASCIALMATSSAFASTAPADDPDAPVLMVVVEDPVFVQTITYTTSTSEYGTYTYIPIIFPIDPLIPFEIVTFPNVSSVPLPAGGLLLLGGLLGMTGLRRMTSKAD